MCQLHERFSALKVRLNRPCVQHPKLVSNDAAIEVHLEDVSGKKEEIETVEKERHQYQTPGERY